MSDGFEREANINATFLPMDKYDEDTLPCIEVGGVQVYVYFDDGALTISTHYDTADPSITTEHGTVPTRVNIGGTVVWEAP